MKKFILAVLAVLAVLCPFFKAVMGGSDWLEFFSELIIGGCAAYVLYVIISILNRLDKSEGSSKNK